MAPPLNNLFSNFKSEGDESQENYEALELHEYNVRLASISLAKGLKNFRAENDLSQAQMAKLMSVSKRSYLDYERSDRSVPSAALVELVAWSDVDLNLLFRGAERPVTSQYRVSVIRQARAVEKIVRGFGENYDNATIQEAVETYLGYFEPTAPIDRSMLGDILNSIAYEKHLDSLPDQERLLIENENYLREE